MALDRPGYGSSTGSWATKEWTYEDFARDVEAVADAIGVDRFYVSGHSSGGPCALACAAHIPEEIEALAGEAFDWLANRSGPCGNQMTSRWLRG